MNAQKTIAYLILNYPRLYKDINFKYSKEKALNHLFFTNGNGFDWIDGELFIEDKNVSEIIPEEYFNTPIMSTEQDEPDFARRWRLEEGKVYKPHEIKSTNALILYPICKYAQIMNLPNNIKKDWLEAAEEAITLGLDYWNNPYKQFRDVYIKEWSLKREYAKIDNYIKEQLNYLKQAQKRIEELKQ